MVTYIAIGIAVVVAFLVIVAYDNQLSDIRKELAKCWDARAERIEYYSRSSDGRFSEFEKRLESFANRLEAFEQEIKRLGTLPKVKSKAVMEAALKDFTGR